MGNAFFEGLTVSARGETTERIDGLLEFILFMLGERRPKRFNIEMAMSSLVRGNAGEKKGWQPMHHPFVFALFYLG